MMISFLFTQGDDDTYDLQEANHLSENKYQYQIITQMFTNICNTSNITSKWTTILVNLQIF